MAVEAKRGCGGAVKKTTPSPEAVAAIRKLQESRLQAVEDAAMNKWEESRRGLLRIAGADGSTVKDLIEAAIELRKSKRAWHVAAGKMYDWLESNRRSP